MMLIPSTIDGAIIAVYAGELEYKTEYYRRLASEAAPGSSTEVHYNALAWAFANALLTLKEALNDVD